MRATVDFEDEHCYVLKNEQDWLDLKFSKFPDGSYFSREAYRFPCIAIHVGSIPSKKRTEQVFVILYNPEIKEIKND